MNELLVPVIVAATIVIAVAIICATALSAWRGWLSLKHQQIGQTASPTREGESKDTAALIEIAAVRERLRRLEAIAAGVEL